MIDASADCLTLECVRAATACAATFNPLPTAYGVACSARVAADAMSVDGSLEPVECSGAFGSWEASANWLAGWSSLFPRHVGEAPRSADGLAVGGERLSVTLSTGFLRANTVVTSRKAAELQQLRVLFTPGMCARSAFSPDADAHTNAPVYWLLLRPQQAGMLRLSTCSTAAGVGFDTDLAVLREPLPSGSSGSCIEPEQLACNGDGYGEVGTCQHLYSVLSVSVEVGQRYLIALKGHDSSKFGDNVTLTASVLPPTPPAAPPPPPPPPKDQLSDIQHAIDTAPNSSEPLLIHLDTLTELTSTVRVPGWRRVVVRGTNATSSMPLVRPTGGSFRLFDVADGGELYLANLHLEAGASMGCGGAVRVRGRGVLVAQYCRFERNRADKGGAICIEDEGRLQLVAVNISNNTAITGVGGNMYLGRPLTTYPQVDMLGVCIGRAQAVNSELPHAFNANGSCHLW